MRAELTPTAVEVSIRREEAVGGVLGAAVGMGLVFLEALTGALFVVAAVVVGILVIGAILLWSPLGDRRADES
jgi:hypothetical protein